MLNAGPVLPWLGLSNVSTIILAARTEPGVDRQVVARDDNAAGLILKALAGDAQRELAQTPDSA